MAKAKAKLVEFVNVSTTTVSTERGIRIYTTAAARDGSIWERWGDWTEGRWEEIRRPVSAVKPSSG